MQPHLLPHEAPDEQAHPLDSLSALTIEQAAELQLALQDTLNRDLPLHFQGEPETDLAGVQLLLAFARTRKSQGKMVISSPWPQSVERILAMAGCLHLI